jgi:hypothetical protein
VYEPDEGDTPISNVTLLLHSLDGGPDRSVTTGLDGKYAFTDLPLGNYQVEVTDDFGVLQGQLPVTGADSRDQPYQTTLGLQSSDMSADFGYQFAPSDYIINNTVIGNSPVRHNEIVTFSVTITNTGVSWLAIEPLRVEYDPEYLQYENADIAPDADDAESPGLLEWNDLTKSFGRDLAPGESFTLMITFITLKDTTDSPQDPNGSTSVTATSFDVWADADGPDGDLNANIPLSEKTDEAAVQVINPTGFYISELGVEPAPWGMKVTWQTLSEVSFVGFNVLRTSDGVNYELLNDQVIDARYAGSPQGANYIFYDNTATPGQTWRYMLEALLTDGSVAQYYAPPITTPWWVGLPFVVD